MHVVRTQDPGGPLTAHNSYEAGENTHNTDEKRTKEGAGIEETRPVLRLEHAWEGAGHRIWRNLATKALSRRPSWEHPVAGCLSTPDFSPGERM